MRPGSTIQDGINSLASDAKRRRNFERCLALLAHGTNLAHVIFSEFGGAVGTTSLYATPRVAHIGSSDMCPVLALKNGADGFARDAVLNAQFGLRNSGSDIAATNLYDLFFGELGMTMLFTANNAIRVGSRVVQFSDKASRSTFFGTILEVIKRRTSKDMRGIAAWGMIALVANKLIQRVSTMPQKVSDSVSLQVAPLGLELPIAVTKLGVFPLPAVVGATYGDLRPEASNVFGAKFGKWFGICHDVLHARERMNQMFCDLLYTAGIAITSVIPSVYEKET